jgi:hypothetical protein
MGVLKFGQPILAPSFTPAVTGIELSDLAQGTDGQIPIASTGGATAYHALSGDMTATNAGVTTIGAGKVTKAKAKVFFSAQVSTTGSAQNVAHGLAATPSAVLIVPTDGATVTPGAHDGTNVVFTATTGKKVDILAWA